MLSRSVGRADSGSKIDGSAKAESVESGEKIGQSHKLPQENNNLPSFSCNAIVYSGQETSKKEVTRGGKASLRKDSEDLELDYAAANGIGPPKGESNYEEAIEFDPIIHHNQFCPWVNGNVAAAGCSNGGSSSTADIVAHCGWQLTLDALDALRSLGHLPIQTVQSESAASLYKVLFFILYHVCLHEILLAGQSPNSWWKTAGTPISKQKPWAALRFNLKVRGAAASNSSPDNSGVWLNDPIRISYKSHYASVRIPDERLQAVVETIGNQVPGWSSLRLQLLLEEKSGSLS
ncbi:hypothetical protein CK203_036573 [Vitis vinifera]|uniref:NuBaID C-terminal domain-containing protein n=1 Tax=Vitis vinifera TaxID=29760 RepID=A0A438HZS6_VITVI|nr:hypothetical protein CK203_036573 [Vitis vinifera]